MFVEKELNKGDSPFQKDHIYILRGVVNAKKHTLAGTAGTLDGRKGGMVFRLADIEEDGTHVFHEMVYARGECQIALDGYDCVYAIEPKELNISDFEDITDDADFAELLRSMKENEKEAASWIKRTNIRDTLIETAIWIIVLLLPIAVILIEAHGLVYIKNNNLEIPVWIKMIYICFSAFFIFGIYTSPDWLYPLCSEIESKIEKAVNKKDEKYLETIYQKNDVLLRAFEQKKRLERT
jgi:hypothetical protein